MNIKYTALSCLVVVGLVSPFALQAQESPSEEVILQKQRLDEEIEQLSIIYRGQLNEYRLAEKDFQIARDQYQRLNTLASIDKVVELTRKVMQLRAQVLSTYFELLRVNLIASEGIELSLKQAVTQRLEAQQNWLQLHQQAIVSVDDREEFNQLADTFLQRAAVFQAVYQEANSLLAVGKLQDVFDRLNLLAEDMTAFEASDSTAVSARAVREVGQVTDQLDSELQLVWQELRVSIQERKIASFYNNLTKDLNPIYASTNQLISFLDELLRAL
jgi:hypothetical protein